MVRTALLVLALALGGAPHWAVAGNLLDPDGASAPSDAGNVLDPNG